jgi:hypothetical protein
MKKVTCLVLGSCLLFAGANLAKAQDKPQGTAHPKVLVIQREFMKPGKAGAVHEKSESAFVQAFARAKWPTHYLGMTSLSGKSRALFLVSYDSFEAWEQDTQAQAKNGALSAALDRAGEADGALQDSFDQGVFLYRPEYSQHTMSDISHMRYMEISVFRVRPGHDKDWADILKLVKAAYEKGVPEAHWATYENAYGREGGTFIVLTARKTTAELDRGPQESKQFEAAMGEDGMKKLSELFGAAIESSESQLFAFNPHMSYVADDWIKGDPGFWKTKPAAPAAGEAKKTENEKKSESKP